MLEKMTPHILGVSDQDKLLRLVPGPKGNCGASLLKPICELAYTHLTIPCLSIDQIIEQKIASAPTIVKVDVEGMESKVISGAIKLLSIKPPKVWVIESLSSQKGELEDLNLLKTMKDFGYNISKLERKYGKIESVENFLFVHKGLEK